MDLSEYDVNFILIYDTFIDINEKMPFVNLSRWPKIVKRL